MAAIVAAAGSGLRAADGGGVTESIGASIAVRTYTPAGTQAAMGSARQTAGAILERAGVQVAWLECSPAQDGILAVPAACAQPTRSNELVVRVVPGAAADPGAGRKTLGVAYVDLEAGGGSLATVYADRVRVVAESAGVDMAELLGRAVAHEIGHLLLGTNRHSSRGLMRASWTDATLRRAPTSEWHFNVAEGDRMRRAVAGRLRPYN